MYFLNSPHTSRNFHLVTAEFSYGQTCPGVPHLSDTQTAGVKLHPSVTQQIEAGKEMDAWFYLLHQARW